MSASIWNPGSTIQTATGNGTVTEKFLLTSGQTAITLATYTYTPGANALKVFLNGVLQVIGYDYLESSASSILLTSPATAGDTLELLGIINLINVTGGLTTNVELDIAVATTTNIGGASTNFVQVVGTGVINSFGNAYRGPIFLRFTAAVTLTAGANLITPGGININLISGSNIIVTPKATNGIADGWVVRI